MSEGDQKLFRIGGNLYDLGEFFDKHPGGRQILELQHEFFEDATYAFEAHHMNQPRVRRMLKKHYVGPAVEGTPLLTGRETFYADFRQRVAEYLRQNGGAGPTRLGLAVWWVVVAGLLISHAAALVSGSLWCAIPLAFFSGLVGAYGHNWIHQPKYRRYANCLDLIGISSAQWHVLHVLRHHMFTNTPRDNHWSGTAPFMVVDPVKERNLAQRTLTPLYQPVVLFFGVIANWVDHLLGAIKHEDIRTYQLGWPKLFLPLLFVAYGVVLGPKGVLILLVALGLASVWYFTVALANHNTEAAWDLEARAQARDWGEAQLLVSADVGVNLSYIASGMYVWLNYHTVHHLVPAVDQSHHPRIQRILIECCEEHGVEYRTYSFWRLYREMLGTFTRARYTDLVVNWRRLWSEHATPSTLSEATVEPSGVDAGSSRLRPDASADLVA